MHFNNETLDEMVEGYLECALWLATDEHCEQLDERYSVSAFTNGTRAAVRAACERFVEIAIHNLEQLDDRTDYDNGWIGHNLFLTAAGHGTGFWDRDLGDLGDRLSDAARASHWVESAYECGNNRHLGIWIEIPS